MAELDAGGSVPALRTERLGRRYGKEWGLRDCTIEVPAGAVAALVGPNGAGKTTLLEMIIGLLEPTEGQVSVFGETSRAGTAETLARVGYVAQDHPLYRDFSVADMFHLGRAMNPSWDQKLAAARVDALGIPLKRKVRRLSGGQQAQVSLTMALAKRAPLVVLDEPVSSLDPIARLEFMRDVMASAADAALTFLISSHVVSELERFCDWLIVLADGHVQLAGPADDLLAAHRLLTVPRATPNAELPGRIIHRTDSDRHSTVLARTDPAELAVHGRSGWQAEPVSFEQLVLGYLQRPSAAATPDDPAPAPAAERPGPSHQGGNAMIWVSWRQHRGQAIACLGVLAALAVYAILAGTSMRTAFGNDSLTACLARSQGTACPTGVSAFMNEFGSEVNVAFWSVALIVPGLIGVLVGGSLIARELEYGTWRLAWSQTVPRARWLAVKLALVTGGLIVLGAAMTAVITWYRAPMDRLTGHLEHNIYDFEGLVLTAYILCAFGFAVLAGLLLRRSVLAMVAAFVPWLAIRLVVEFLFRPHFLAPLTATANCTQRCGEGIGFVPQATGRVGDLVLSINGNVVTYQPADRFWPFQLIEAGIFVALTAAALGATIWLLHRRAAWTA